MNNLKTVSDTKRAFYSYHSKPINSVYRRVVEELMVEMHLLSVNADFKPDGIYYLGVVNSFDRFMEGYQPEEQRQSIFNALCRSIDGDPEYYRSQAETLLSVAENKTSDELIDWLINPTSTEGGESIIDPIREISNNSKFKYSRLFGIGLYSVLEKCDSELVKDKEKLDKVVDRLTETLHLPEEKTKKDLENYRSNLGKMEQLLKVMDDMLEANRKQREKRALEKQEREAKLEKTEESKSSEPSLEKEVNS